MDGEDFYAYLRASEILAAQESLNRLSEHDWPHLKQNRRAQMHKQLFKLAYPDSKPRTISAEEFKKLVQSGKL